ncbi:MAG TPA: hypothetical protein VGH13_16355 [Xanthobacteraceae bacterium]
MQDLAQGVRQQIIKETAPKVAPAGAFTMRSVRHAALWGATAAAALLIAALSSHGDFDMARLADGFRGGGTSPAPRPLDAQAETQRLAQAVHGLTIDNDQLKARLASVEQDLNDVTGSIGKQIEAVQTADASRRVEDGPSITATASVSTMLPAVLLPAATAFPPGPAPDLLAANQPAADAAAVAPTRAAYGVDIGSGLTIQALRTRWAAIRSAHPDVLDGLEPILSVREIPRANHVELRLVAGPLPDAGAAAQLCASLTPMGLFCQPAMYDGQHLAVR